MRDHSEHHAGLFVGVTPLLVMDVWEHAYFFAIYVVAAPENPGTPRAETRPASG